MRSSLRSSDNIEKYKDIVLGGCLHNLSYDTQCEGTRAAYVYQLVCCFHDDTYFIEPTVAAFLKLPRHQDSTFEHLCELLQLFAENGSMDAKNALYAKYDQLLFSLIAKRRGRSYDYERDNFERACISLTSFGGREALFKIAEDMGALFNRNPHYDSADFAEFFSDLEDKFGKKRLVSLLKHESQRSENILRLYENYKRNLAGSHGAIHEPIKALCADDLIKEVNATGKLSPATRVRFSKCTEDGEKRRSHYRYFGRRTFPKRLSYFPPFIMMNFPCSMKR